MKSLAETLRGGEKKLLPKNYRSHNPKTWKHIHKMFGIQSETSLLINCGKISSLSTKKWGNSWPERSSLIAQNYYL